MNDLDEYNMLVRMYNMVISYASQKGASLPKEDGQAISNYFEMLRLKAKKLGYNIDNCRRTASTPKTTAQNEKKTYHRVSIYNPFYNVLRIPNVVRGDYEQHDSIYQILTAKGTRTVQGFWNNHEETYYYRKNFPILVEKDGNTIRDIITKEEMILVPSNIKQTQVRYKGNYYYLNENYLTDKIAVSLQGSLPDIEVADMLRKLTKDDVALYKQKMREIKNSIIKQNRDYFDEKRRYTSTHLSDEEYIRRFGK